MLPERWYWAHPMATHPLIHAAIIHDIVTRGGKCLIPVFALGRAQELLLILGELIGRAMSHARM